MLIQIQNQACFLKCSFVVAENGEEHVAAVNGVAKKKPYWTCLEFKWLKFVYNR